MLYSAFSSRLDDVCCDYHQKERFRQQWQLLSIHGGFQYPLGLRARSLFVSVLVMENRGFNKASVHLQDMIQRRAPCHAYNLGLLPIEIGGQKCPRYNQWFL